MSTSDGQFLTFIVMSCVLIPIAVGVGVSVGCLAFRFLLGMFNDIFGGW